jgi:3-dehydroquinate dehydratase
MREARPAVLVPTTSQHDSRALIDDCSMLVAVPTTEQQLSNVFILVAN